MQIVAQVDQFRQYLYQQYNILILFKVSRKQINKELKLYDRGQKKSRGAERKE